MVEDYPFVLRMTLDNSVAIAAVKSSLLYSGQKPQTTSAGEAV
jgi:hypothetical protein